MDNKTIELVTKLVAERELLCKEDKEYSDMMVEVEKFVRNTYDSFKDSPIEYWHTERYISTVKFCTRAGEQQEIVLSSKAFYDLMNYASQQVSQRINNINKQLQEL